MSKRTKSSPSGMPEYTVTEDMQQKFLQYIAVLKKNPHSAAFRAPVDFIALDIPDYPKVIKQPMDLGTIQQNAKKGVYKTSGAYWRDLDLVWSNCQTYNQPGSNVYQDSQVMEEAANKLKEQFLAEQAANAQSYHPSSSPPDAHTHAHAHAHGAPSGTPPDAHTHAHAHAHGAPSGIKRKREADAAPEAAGAAYAHHPHHPPQHMYAAHAPYGAHPPHAHAHPHAHGHAHAHGQFPAPAPPATEAVYIEKCRLLRRMQKLRPDQLAKAVRWAQLECPGSFVRLSDTKATIDLDLMEPKGFRGLYMMVRGFMKELQGQKK